MSLGLTDMRGAADARWSGAAEAGGENCVCNFGIEVVGVEVFTQPLTSLGVLWMSRIGAHSSPHFALASFEMNTPAFDTASAKFCISGAILCSGMLGMRS